MYTLIWHFQTRMERTLPGLFFLFVFCLILFTNGCENNNSILHTIEPDDTVIKFQSESQNFTFYSTDNDRRTIQPLRTVLESNYDRITSHLVVTPQSRIKIEIYPDIRSFHEALGNPDLPDWVVGVCTDPRSIRIVSPLNPGPVHDYEFMVNYAVVHEFSHAVTLSISPRIRNMPVWLFEGVATFEANQPPDDDFIRNAIRNESVPALRKLNTERFAGLGGYQFGYTIVEFILHDYGIDKLILLTLVQDRDFSNFNLDSIRMSYTVSSKCNRKTI